jgi:hypothetical protein
VTALEPGGATLVVAAVALLVADVAVRRVRAYTMRHRVIDLPTERSSHTVPTPRGGGLAVVVAVLVAAVPALALAGLPVAALALGALAVCAVAAVGWLDDHRPLPPACDWWFTWWRARPWHCWPTAGSPRPEAHAPCWPSGGCSGPCRRSTSSTSWTGSTV